MKKVKKNVEIVLFCMMLCVGVVSCKKDDDVKVKPPTPPTITAISPTSGPVGTTVTISGTNFGTKTSDISVKFNGIVAKVTTSTETSITTSVPAKATTGTISVSIGATVIQNRPTFTVTQSPPPKLPPKVVSYEPTRGKVGTTVIITGTNFSSTPTENIVKFNGIAAKVTAATTTTITTAVPQGATTGKVSVTVEGKTGIGPEFAVVISGTVSLPITATDDDVEEGETGPMDMNSSDLEFGEFDTSGTPDRGIQIIGLRFNKITVPAKAKITSASIQFTCDNTGSKPVEMTIYCQNIGNAPKFVDEVNNVTKRTKSEEKVVWSIPPWLTKQEKGADQKTPDLKALVQAIINRTDWRPDNSIVFIMENTGVSANVKSNKGGREAETFDGTDGGVDAPVLKIDWEK